jgi:hypothetical protein
VVAVAPEILGVQSPRIELIPDGDEHPRWDEVVDFIADLGIVLDPWQLRVLWASLLRRGKLWAAFIVGVCAPRQNGKNGILEVRELAGAYLLGEKLQIHSAHLADTSMEGFRRLDDLIDANAELSKNVTNIRRQNGHEQITFRGGKRIRFRTRTRGGGRGFSGSPVMFDEAMFLPEVSYGAMLPVISAQPDPQVWQTGSAVDQMIMDEGVIFTRTREQALAGEDRIAWFEWSLDYDSPDDVPNEVMSTLEAQAQANPALGIRISPEYVAAELGTLPARVAAVERFGVGDWPKTDGLATVIDLVLWLSLTDEHSAALDPVVFAFDVRPDRSRSVIAAVGRRSDGFIHVEIIDQREGTGWLVERLAELEERHLPAGIVCDGVGPAASLLPQLEQRNVTIEVLDTPQMGQACGMLYDAVEQEQIRHLGTTDLVSAIKGAVQRPLGDRWAWSRRNSSSDISPLVAVTLGVWKVISEEMQAPMFGFGR